MGPQGPPGHDSGREEGDAGCSELRALGQARRGQVREAVLRSAIGALLTYGATFVLWCVLYRLICRTNHDNQGAPQAGPCLVFFCPVKTGHLVAVIERTGPKATK